MGQAQLVLIRLTFGPRVREPLPPGVFRIVVAVVKKGTTQAGAPRRCLASQR